MRTTRLVLYNIAICNVERTKKTFNFRLVPIHLHLTSICILRRQLLTLSNMDLTWLPPDTYTPTVPSRSERAPRPRGFGNGYRGLSHRGPANRWQPLRIFPGTGQYHPFGVLNPEAPDGDYWNLEYPYQVDRRADGGFDTNDREYGLETNRWAYMPDRYFDSAYGQFGEIDADWNSYHSRPLDNYVGMYDLPEEAQYDDVRFDLSGPGGYARHAPDWYENAGPGGMVDGYDLADTSIMHTMGHEGGYQVNFDRPYG